MRMSALEVAVDRWVPTDLQEVHLHLELHMDFIGPHRGQRCI